VDLPYDSINREFHLDREIFPVLAMRMIPTVGQRRPISNQVLIDDEARYVIRQPGKDFVIQKARQVGKRADRYLTPILLAYQHNFIADAGAFNSGNIDHYAVHVDGSDNGSAFSPDQDPAEVAEAARKTGASPRTMVI
jgi:hypothetical protein